MKMKINLQDPWAILTQQQIYINNMCQMENPENPFLLTFQK